MSEADDIIIEVKDLTAGYDGTTVLEDVSFTVKRGEIFLIVGGSGCGKSTLLRHLIGLQEPMSGDVVLAGDDWTVADEVTRQRMRRRFGVLFQKGAMFGSMTLAENIELLLREYTDMPTELIHSVTRVKLGLLGLQAHADALPSQLSGGQLKRAGLARAMALEPEILFFDEPSSGLDPVTAADLDNLILQLHELQGTTMVIVTHDLASIYEIASRVIMLDKSVKGILATGEPDDLRDHPNVHVRRFFRRASSKSAASDSDWEF